MNKLLYISTGIPTEEVECLKRKQFCYSSNAFQTISVFHGNILDGLTECYDEIIALSGVPIDRKKFKINYYPSKKIRKGNILYILPSFINFPLIKQVMVAIKIFFYILKWCKDNKKDNRNIIVDGTFYTALPSLFLTSKIIKQSIMMIIVDYYQFMNPERKNIKQKIYYKMLECVNCFSFVTKQLEELVNLKHKKFIIVEGLVNREQSQDQEQNIRECFVYAGGLHEIYGVKNLVDAFLESDTRYELHLYGNGDMIDYIKEISKRDSRIKYKGIVSHDDMLTIERTAKILINPRPVFGKLDTRYNFPSKLMEYMQSGRPVLTTKLLGIPKEYEKYMLFIEDDSKEGIKKCIDDISKYDEKTLDSVGQRGKQYINENKNSYVIAKKMFCLMNNKDI